MQALSAINHVVHSSADDALAAIIAEAHKSSQSDHVASHYRNHERQYPSSSGFGSSAIGRGIDDSHDIARYAGIQRFDFTTTYA
jgi:hypothetical protein